VSGRHHQHGRAAFTGHGMGAGNEGGFHKVAGARQALPAHQHVATLRHRIGHPLLERAHRTLRVKRATQNAGLAGVAHFDLAATAR
jgi:hypothetical protein